MMKRKIFLILYYGFARWLPACYRPGGKCAKRARVWCCRHIFESCGKDVNVERGAHEDDVWIGADVMIVGNRRVRRDPILAARTVVVKEFPEMSIIGKNPFFSCTHEFNEAGQRI